MEKKLKWNSYKFSATAIEQHEPQNLLRRGIFITCDISVNLMMSKPNSTQVSFRKQRIDKENVCHFDFRIESHLPHRNDDKQHLQYLHWHQLCRRPTPANGELNQSHPHSGRRDSQFNTISRHSAMVTQPKMYTNWNYQNEWKKKKKKKREKKIATKIEQRNEKYRRNHFARRFNYVMKMGKICGYSKRVEFCRQVN